MFSKIFDMFTRVVTAIVFFEVIYIFIFYGMDSKGAENLWETLIVAALTSIGCAPCLPNEELSKNATIVRSIIYFGYVNVVVWVCGFMFEWFVPSDIGMIIGLELTITLVYIVVFLLTYWSEWKTAEKMNQKLKERELEQQNKA